MAGGRPEKYTDELAAIILEQIATTSNSLKVICEANELSVSTVQKWLREDKEFSVNYARAKSDQADLLADEILRIADNPLIGTKTKTTDYGGVISEEVVEGDNVERSKVMIDARKWHAAHLNPKKYGVNKQPEKSDTPPVSFEDFINKIDNA